EKNEEVLERNCPKNDQFMPLPPPPDNYEENVLPLKLCYAMLEMLTERFSTLEEQITRLNQR
ncbi:hypothetical protein M9458_036846, partial [Cirrhinus mrigala]